MFLHEQAPQIIITTIKFSIGDVHEPTQVTIAHGFHRYMREAMSPVLTLAAKKYKYEQEVEAQQIVSNYKLKALDY